MAMPYVVSKSEKRSASGKLGGLAKSLKNNDAPLANAKQMPKHLSESDIRYIKNNTLVLFLLSISISFAHVCLRVA